MQNNFGYYVMLVIAVVLFESIAQYHIKQSKLVKHRALVYMLVAIVSYTIVCLLLQRCYEFNGVGYTNLTWSVLSIVSMIAIGAIMFHERFTWVDGVGTLLCFIGLYFIFGYDHGDA
jgi:drug/metabolite transporter (DMT)-like permease